MNSKKEILAFIAIVFALLGALFGANIMGFIFGNLGPSNAGIPTSSFAYNVSATIQNNSLQAVSTYASNGTTQMNIMNVVIILLLLVAVFAFFWKTFIGGSGGGSRGGSSGGMNFQ